MRSDVADVVSSVLRIPRETVSDTLSMENCANWDSLAHVDLMVALESTFGVTINEDQIFDLVNVGAIRRFVDARGHGVIREGAADQ